MSNFENEKPNIRLRIFLMATRISLKKIKKPKNKTK